MSNIEIVLIAVVFAVLGIRLYKKYIRKDERETGFDTPKKTGSSFSSPSHDDDYEPYSKK
jgi:hypothetical protein